MQRFKIKIARIKTSELNDLELVKQKLNGFIFNTEYKNLVFKPKTLDEKDKNYMMAIRIEMLLLSLYENKHLRPIVARLNVSNANVSI